MVNLPGRESVQANREGPVLLDYLIASVMMVCVAAALTGLIQSFIPSWNETYVLVVCFIVSLETLYTTRATRRSSFPSRAWFSYRGTELVAILVLLKLLLYAMHGWGQLLADIPLWQQDFFMNFFTGEFLAVSVIVLLVWVLAHQLNNDLLELEADDATLERERKYEFRNDRPGIRNQLMLKIVLIGALLMVVTVATRSYLLTLGGEAAAARVNVWNLLIYVFMGLLLLSQTRLAALRASWFRERATIGPEVARHWVIYSIIFLGLLAVVAALLPTRYSMGLLATLNYLLGWLLAILQVIVYIVLIVVTFPLTLLMSLFGQSTTQPSQPQLPPTPPPSLAQGPASPDPLFEVIKSVLFWLIFLSVVAWSLAHFLGQHREWLKVLRRIPVLRWLVQGAAWLWQVVRRANRTLTGAINAGLSRLRPQQPLSQTIAERRRLFSLGRLTPRERVQYFYLAMVRRGGQRGIPRKPSQTPSEYAATLESQLPDVDAEIGSLTDAFTEARYSRHDVTPEQASLVQRIWDRIKATLRRL
ncbi:MAG TPA: DUF4129 domain-containing protein [Anaerolineae bacterium]